MEAAMLRSAMMVGVIALCCAGVAQSAEAHGGGGGMGHGGVGFSHGGIGFNRGSSFGGRGFARFPSPRFGQRAGSFEQRRFLVNRGLFDRNRDDRFFFRDRFRFRNRFPFGNGFG